MHRQQVLVLAVAAVALLSFGIAADGLDTDSPQVGQTPEQTGESDSLRDLPEMWDFPGCDPCDVDTQPVVASAADSLPPVVLVGVAVLGAIAVGGAYVTAGRGDETLALDTEAADEFKPAGPPPDASPVHEAPDPPPENDVYRAWRTLADHVGADPALTPGECADRARNAGLNPDAVETLTTVFRQVRYGDTEPTDRLGRRAREARDALASDDQRSGDRTPPDGEVSR